MKLIDLLVKEELRDIRVDLLIALGLCGLANAGILFIVNAADTIDANDDAHLKLLILFIITVCTYIFSIQYACETITVAFERVLHNVRCRLVEKICDTELVIVERLGQGNIYNILVQDINLISDIKYELIWTLQAAFLLVFALLYIAILSPQALLVVAVLGIVGTLIYWNMQQRALPFFEQAIRRQGDLIDGVSHLLDGFNELKISRERRTDLHRDLIEISSLGKDAVVNSDGILFRTGIFSRYFFFIVWGSVVFLVPKLFPSEATDTTDLATAVLFVFGPLTSVIGAIPRVTRANLAAERIDAFEKDIDQFLIPPSLEASKLSAASEGFSEISMNNLEFTYYDPDNNPLFSVGPLTFTISAGEIIFVVGGNGSGKSTLMKLLTALYYGDHGEIKLDNEVITPYNAQDYRQRFSLILSDFHLFPKLYGIKNVDTEKVSRLLKLMEIDKKTQFVDDHFTNLDLSTGQKKRLALVIVFLEDRPIYVFDEWAADQDPEFRRYFYEVMLRELKEEGKTIIAVSHDDRYFHVADRILKMDYGKIVDEG